ncbi:MAG: T9SS type A sorting domain-containing protein [Microscillaceae bacterium]|nr:T9SS type A sorting domain-containing protein [Microscillaceae bacterium]MDW8460199.1 T9SS type A sorting domain-containing protein [Cytophagales bacterium]
MQKKIKYVCIGNCLIFVANAERQIGQVGCIITWVLFLWGGLICQTKGQLLIQPEPQNINLLTRPTQTCQEWQSYQYTTEAVPLTLPFFDDFSTTKTYTPDTTLWFKSGVYINNDLPINPPTFNVASFDGLNAAGMPYNFADAFAEGYADTLTSKPIDLSPYSPADSLYLSFFWQATGLGEMPDNTDSLSVWFKDNTNTWRYVWGKLGSQEIDQRKFFQVLLPVRNTIFFHSQFQFRFMAKGRLSGPYDVWHIDYVYLNINRYWNDFFVKDVACTISPNFVLKPYTAMPMKHFRANPILFSTDTLKTQIMNQNNVFNVVQHQAQLKESVTNTNLGNLGSGFVLLNGSQRQNYDIAHQPSLIPTHLDSAKIMYEFVINSGDNATTIQGINLRRNDTIRRVTHLTNYLAYDDGTAEYGAGTNQRLAQVACRFFIPEKDTITDVQMYVMPMETNLLGQTFVLTIWKKLTNRDEDVLHRQSVPITYPTQRNKFFNIKLNKAIPVQDTFYIGWRQNTNDMLTVGFDRNTDSGSHIFYNILNVWAENTQLKGSFMIRPVFGKSTITQSIDYEIISPIIQVYPNPATHYLVVEGLAMQKIELYDTNSVLWHTQEANGESKLQIDQLEKLPQGQYFLKIYTLQGNLLVQKVIIF